MDLNGPSHPDDFAVEFCQREYSSSLRSLKVNFITHVQPVASLVETQSFAAGEVMVYLNGITKSARTFKSVQYGMGTDENIELNSDLAYRAVDKLNKLK